MNHEIFVYPYNAASVGARELTDVLGARRIRRENSKFKGNADKVVINWGNSVGLPEEIEKANVLNPAQAVGNVSNKRTFFEMLSNQPVSVPQWTTNKTEAGAWLAERRCTIFARTKLNGHSGEGIVEINTPEHLSSHKDGTLFVKYIPKKDEYRIHITGLDGIIDVQRKARSFQVAEPNWRIRNHQNGFIYARGNAAEIPQCVKDQAMAAFQVSGLDFGGVDVLYNEKRDTAYVLEINSAPGLEGTTIRKYAGALDRMCCRLLNKKVEGTPF